MDFVKQCRGWGGGGGRGVGGAEGEVGSEVYGIGKVTSVYGSQRGNIRAR